MRNHLSFSAYMEYRKCPANAWDKDNRPKDPPTDAMLIGSYIDHALLGGLPDFLRENSERIFKWPTLAQIATLHPELKGEKLRDIQVNYPEILIEFAEFKSDFRIAQNIVDFCSDDEEFMRLLSGEHQQVIDFELAGIPWSGKIDIENDFIIDLKSTESIDEWKWSIEHKMKVPFHMIFRYDIQLALYQAARENIKPCALLAVSKEDPPDKAFMPFDQVILDKAIQEVLFDQEDIWEMSQQETNANLGRCERCAFCRGSRNVRTIRIDEWPEEHI